MPKITLTSKSARLLDAIQKKIGMDRHNSLDAALSFSIILNAPLWLDALAEDVESLYGETMSTVGGVLLFQLPDNDSKTPRYTKMWPLENPGDEAMDEESSSETEGIISFEQRKAERENTYEFGENRANMFRVIARLAQELALPEEQLVEQLLTIFDQMLNCIIKYGYCQMAYGLYKDGKVRIVRLDIDILEHLAQRVLKVHAQRKPD